ncbi:MAG: anti-sigma factor family protein [Planctomycetota bacterium]|jgi:hypothetical protein
MHAMDCNDIKALLSAFVDDELNAEQRHLAERHLADCPDCRSLVNQAESLDELIAAEIDADTTGALPEGFEETVLSRTVYAQAPRPYAYRLSTWTGWIAAAACLGLALTIWVSDTRIPELDGQAAAPAGDQTPTIQQANLRTPSFLRSFVHVGTLPEEPEPDEIEPVQVAHVAPEPADAPPATWDEDELTLLGTSMLMAMLDDADLRTFEDVEHIRRIAEYDELLPRLSATRDRLPAESRPPVFAAETILHRIVNGPVSLDDVQALRETAADLHLTDEVDSISRRWSGANSA